MTDLMKQRLAENKNTPYMAQHEIVFELIELEKNIDLLNSQISDLQKSLSILLSENKDKV